MSFINMPSAWQWCVLAAIPAGIVLLYFLRLKRERVEVPSTLLWRKSIEDLRVNSPWQRMRKNLLLLLQLLVVALAMAALVRPGWRGGSLTGNRFIFLIDTSASMSATDVKPTRLDEAKRRAAELVEQMAAGDRAMVASFAENARVEQTFTDNRALLGQKIAAIEPTNFRTRLDEALHVVAGLAKPAAALEAHEGEAVGEIPTTLYILSDGKFPGVGDFSLGNLEPVFIAVGESKAPNVGIVSFSTRRREGRSDQLQAFTQLENFGPVPVTAEVELLRDGELLDAEKIALKPHGTGAVVFELGDFESGNLHLRTRHGGALALDDEAWSVVEPPSPSRVLMVTPGNDALELALRTDSARDLAIVDVGPPTLLASDDYLAKAGSGYYSLVIYDQCQPKALPEANTLFIGRIPLGGAWSAGEKMSAPQIIDVDTAHPLVQMIDLGNVKFSESTPLKPPTASTALIDSDKGPLLAISPRGPFEDAVLGAEIVGTDERGERYANTDWPLRLSFPVFVLNALRYFGGADSALATANVQPGQSVVLRGRGAGDAVEVRRASGKISVLKRQNGQAYTYNSTDELGLYRVDEANAEPRHFAVNLFDRAESDIGRRSDGGIQIGYTKLKGQAGWEGARRELWKLLLLGALGTLALEWYVFVHRVSV